MMNNAELPLEPTASPHVWISRSADGTQRIRFRRGINWFYALFLPFLLYLWAYGVIGVTETLLSEARLFDWGAVFLAVWLVPWTLAGIYIEGTFLWMLFGDEVVQASLARLTHSYRLLQRIRAFHAGQVIRLRYEPQRGRSWPLLAFDYGSRRVEVRRGISSEEASKFVEAIGEALGRGRHK